MTRRPHRPNGGPDHAPTVPNLFSALKAAPPLGAESGFFSPLFLFDRSFGQRPIAGLDEAGRGPLAGPLVAAAVVLPDDFDHGGLNDSKKLTSQALALSFDIVCEKALGWAYSVKSAAEVDKINPLVASLAAMKEALEQIKITPALVLVDGNQRPPLKYFARAIVKGDAKSLSVAAASIVAKVIRDRLMEQEHERYPQYRFDLHKGYATKEHLEALAKFGPSPIHRLTYKGVVPKSDTGTVPKGPSLF